MTAAEARAGIFQIVQRMLPKAREFPTDVTGLRLDAERLLRMLEFAGGGPRRALPGERSDPRDAGEGEIVSEPENRPIIFTARMQVYLFRTPVIRPDTLCELLRLSEDVAGEWERMCERLHALLGDKGYLATDVASVEPRSREGPRPKEPSAGGNGRT